jgi:hypothetical protein
MAFQAFTFKQEALHPTGELRNKEAIVFSTCFMIHNLKFEILKYYKAKIENIKGRCNTPFSVFLIYTFWCREKKI